MYTYELEGIGTWSIDQLIAYYICMTEYNRADKSRQWSWFISGVDRVI